MSVRCDYLELVIKPERIAFLRFILEGYDGIALLSTVDAATGQIIVRYPSENVVEIKTILENIAL